MGSEHGEDHGHSGASGYAVAALGIFILMYVAGMMGRPAVDKPIVHKGVAGPGYSESLPAHGPADAAVVIHEVADFKCRYCGLRNGLMKRLMSEHRDVLFVFKHFPFVSPVSSEKGAIASMAANRQGKFIEYVDQLYLNQSDRWTKDQLIGYAEKLGLDTARFGEDLRDPALRVYVRKDKAAAENIQVRATPTLLINGMQVPNNATPAQLRTMIAHAKKQVKGILARHEATNVWEARERAAATNHPSGEAFARVYMRNDVADLNVTLGVSFDNVE